MITVTGLFDNRERAEEAIRALQDQGVAAEDISVVMRDRREESEIAEDTGTTAASGAVGGGVVGGLAGLLLGLGALSVPGVGPIIAAGPLAGAIGGAITGAATGGLLGALMDLGVEEEEARAYKDGVERGAVLVAVRSEDEQANTVRETMNQYSRPVEEHRRLWEDEPDYRYHRDTDGEMAGGAAASAAAAGAMPGPAGAPIRPEAGTMADDALNEDEEHLVRDRGRGVTDEDLVKREAAADLPEDTVGEGGPVAGGITGGSVGTAGGPRNRRSGEIPVDAQGRSEDPALDEALGEEEGMEGPPPGTVSTVVGGAVGGPTEVSGEEPDRPVGEPASEADRPTGATGPGDAIDAEERNRMEQRERRDEDDL